METTINTNVTDTSREANASNDGVKEVGIDFLSTIPEFASEKKETPVTNTETVTQTPEEIAAAKETQDSVKAEETKLFVEKAKLLGLEENATKEQVQAAEQKIADDFKAKAIELGLPETATPQEIEAKISETTKNEGFVTESELNTGLLDAEDGTFKALLLSKGIEVPADFKEDFESYLAVENQNIEKIRQEAENKGKESAWANLKPEIRAALELANQIPDLSIEQVLNPTIKIDNYLKMDKETLIRADIKAGNPDFTEEMVDIKYQQIKDANREDAVDGMIRMELNKQRLQQQEFHKQKIQEYQGKIQDSKVAADKEKIDQVSKALDRDLTFLDKKVSDIDRQFLRKRISEGAIDQLLSNPEKLARAIMMDEFYEKGIKGYENRVREKVLLDHKKQLHAIPNTDKGSINSTVVPRKPNNEINDILKEDFG